MTLRLGLYCMLSYLITRHTAEIGVRLALDAQPWHITRSVIGEGSGLAVAGTCLGLVGSLATMPLVAHFAFAMRSNDPVTFIAVPVLLGVAVTACVIPTRRAMRTGPIVALRTD